MQVAVKSMANLGGERADHVGCGLARVSLGACGTHDACTALEF